MNCEQVQPSLLDYSRKLLSGPESKKIKAHLKQCSSCEKVLREEVRLYKQLSRLPDEQPHNDVWALVRSRTKRKRIRPLVTLHSMVATSFRRIATASVALILLTIGAYNLALLHIEPPPAPTEQQVIAAVYSDDPIGGHTDAVIDSIDGM